MPSRLTADSIRQAVEEAIKIEPFASLPQDEKDGIIAQLQQLKDDNRFLVSRSDFYRHSGADRRAQSKLKKVVQVSGFPGLLRHITDEIKAVEAVEERLPELQGLGQRNEKITLPDDNNPENPKQLYHKTKERLGEAKEGLSRKEAREILGTLGKSTDGLGRLVFSDPGLSVMEDAEFVIDRLQREADNIERVRGGNAQVDILSPKEDPKARYGKALSYHDLWPRIDTEYPDEDIRRRFGIKNLADVKAEINMVLEIRKRLADPSGKYEGDILDGIIQDVVKLSQEAKINLDAQKPVGEEDKPAKPLALVLSQIQKGGPQALDLVELIPDELGLKESVRDWVIAKQTTAREQVGEQIETADKLKAVRTLWRKVKDLFGGR